MKLLTLVSLLLTSAGCLYARIEQGYGVTSNELRERVSSTVIEKKWIEDGCNPLTWSDHTYNKEKCSRIYQSNTWLWLMWRNISVQEGDLITTNFYMISIIGFYVSSLSIKTALWYGPIISISYEKGWLFCFVVFLFGVVLYWIYIKAVARLNIQKKQLDMSKRLLALEMKALKTQMNPHFIFNILNSIQHAITSQRYDSAQIYLQKFSKLFRILLLNRNHLYSTLDKEVELTRLYLDLEKLRLENKLDYEISVDEDVLLNKIFVPTILLQPYLESSIWNGLKDTEGCRKIWIEFSLEAEVLVILIKDNTTGDRRVKGNQYEDKYIDWLQLNEERLKVMNDSEMSSASITISNLYDGRGELEGALATIRIPVNYSINENV